MKGDNFENTGDIRSYLANGSFVDFKPFDKLAYSDGFISVLKLHVANALWRAQRVFILGGAACGDNQGIGYGPPEGSYCHNGKAWYLYRWKSVKRTLLPPSPGNVKAPPGLEYLGTGAWPLNATDVIRSSLAAYEVGNYNVTPTMKMELAREAIKNRIGGEKEHPAMPDFIFTIPPCDVSATVWQDNILKDHTLVPWGKNYSPIWCDPHGAPLETICSGSLVQTKKFLEAANMKHDSRWWYPKCERYEGYAPPPVTEHDVERSDGVPKPKQSSHVGEPVEHHV